MAPLIQFPRETFQPDPERVKQAAELKQKLLSKPYTTEIYAPEPDFGAKKNDLLPDPDTLDSEWGSADESIYDEMPRNVLVYGALVEGHKDVATALQVSFLSGLKGDPDSEAARDEVEDAWTAFIAWSEGATFYRGAQNMHERGYAAGEVIYDVLEFGRAAGMIAPVAVINRPRKRFGFIGNQPYYKPHGFVLQPRRVDDYKVMFGRAGDLSTRYGRGYGPDCYPTVFAIDAHLRGYQTVIDRFGFLPVVATYPSSWPAARAAAEHRRLVAQWKNVIMIPGEVANDKVELDFADANAAYAAANAVGTARMGIIAKYETWLSFRIQGSQSAAGGQQTGSFAREQTASNDRLWKAPSMAACNEAMINRGFVEPMMLVNRPNLPRAKWPRCTIDAAFGEDLDLFIRLTESAAKMEIPIATATWAERTKIPLAKDGEAVLGSPVQAPPIVTPNANPLASPEMRFSEPMIRIARADGSWSDYHPDELVYVKGVGRRRAAALQGSDVIVADPSRFTRAS